MLCVHVAPFPRSSVWQERGPEYSQLDVVITAVPFRSYRTLLVQAQLLKLVRAMLFYLGGIHSPNPALLGRGAVLAAAI